MVEGIVGIEWWGITIEGFANHAGTSPMNMRQDALLAAAKLLLTYKRMPSGAGHDAQDLAKVSPTGMIFVPSVAVSAILLKSIRGQRIWPTG